MDVVASYFDGDALSLRDVLDNLNPIEREQIKVEHVVQIDLNTLRRSEHHENVILRAGRACR